MQTHSVDTRWFQNTLADKRLSQRGLAKHLKLDPAAVSLMIRGKRKMSAAEAAEVARFLNVGVEEVLGRAGVARTIPDKTKHQPRGTASMGSTTYRKADQPILFEGNQLEIPVPMSDGSVAMLTIPRDLTKADAERISGLVAALARE